MSTFPYSYRKVLIGSGVIRTVGTTADLKAGEIGLFDAKSYKALAAGATYSTNREVLLAQGSFHTKDVLALGHGGYKESVKTRDIEGHFVSSFRVAHPKRPKNHIVAIGYDGVSTTKTLTAEAGKEYFLRIDLKGEPVYKFMQHHLYKIYRAVAPCIDPCTDECTNPIDPNIIADDFVNQINSDPFFNPFVKAEKIVSCNPDIPANPNNVAQTVYHLSLCDTGDGAALSIVAGQYPTYSVSRVSRVDSVSTYEICIPTSAGTPTAFNPAALRAVPNCATCPSGYTLNARLYKYEIVRADAGNGTALTAVNTAYTTSTAVRVNYENGTSKYVVYLASATAPAAAVATDSVLSRGEFLDSVCVENTPAADVAWVSAGTAYKTTRNLTLTVQKTCGGANRLTDIRTAYTGFASKIVGGTAGITVLTAGDCADIYTLDQFNDDCLTDPCDGLATPAFTDLQSFEGAVWAVTPAAIPDETTCLVGIRLSGAYIETKFGNCSFDPNDAYELDAVTISVSQFWAENETNCDLTWPVTELQVPAYASGVGETVYRQLIEFLGYRKEDYFCDPRWRETQDIQVVLDAIDRNKYYKLYYLTYNVPYRNNSTNMYNNEQYEVMVAFEETVDTSAFEQLINGYVTSVGVQLKAL